eukprot:10968578-Ditylum_brightwellii.AAC.1
MTKSKQDCSQDMKACPDSARYMSWHCAGHCMVVGICAGMVLGTLCGMLLGDGTSTVRDISLVWLWAYVLACALGGMLLGIVTGTVQGIKMGTV